MEYIVKRKIDDENELMHWKYIERKKKPGGGYRYIYDKNSNVSERSKKNTNYKAYNEVRKNMKDMESKYTEEGQPFYKSEKEYAEYLTNKYGSNMENWPESAREAYNKKVKKSNEYASKANTSYNLGVKLGNLSSGTTTDLDYMIGDSRKSNKYGEKGTKDQTLGALNRVMKQIGSKPLSEVGVIKPKRFK